MFRIIELKKWIARLFERNKNVSLPGFEGIPIIYIATFFFRGLQQGYITSRAAAISYSIFLAIFPFLIFLFSIIPFIPIDNFQQTLLALIEEFMPKLAYESVKETIVDIITQPRSGLLIFNLILTLYFSTNGINSLIEAFNNTYHDIETRSAIKQYIVAFFILFIISFLLILAVAMMTIGPALLRLILPDSIEESGFIVFIFDVLRWIIVLGLLLMAISSLFYLAPARRKSFRFFSPGSLMATFLIILTTLGFNFYVDNFSSYNAFYGSLGTLMIVLVWIYVNSISLIVGFELNASILHVKSDKSSLR